MKIKMTEKDSAIISKFLKYLACVVAVIFVVRGIVKHFTTGKTVENKTEVSVPEKKDSEKKTGQTGASWVDAVIESGSEEEKKSVPVFEMSSATESSSASSVEYKNLSSIRMKFLDSAKKYLGTPYRYGGSDKKGMDCSGFVYAVGIDAGLGKLPKSSGGLFEYAKPVEKSDMVPGDLVFFIRDGNIYHVAIYIGDGKIMHSMSDGSVTGVAESSLDEPYWSEHYYASGKIMD